MYDVTDRRSFENIRYWIDQMQQQHLKGNVNMNMLLVGSKWDEVKEKVVTTEEGQTLAAEFGIRFWEGSIKADIVVDESCQLLASAVMNELVTDGVNRPSTSTYLRSTASTPNRRKIKLLTIGDSGVGKSCFLFRYAKNACSPMFITTMGVDFKVKHAEVDGTLIGKC